MSEKHYELRILPLFESDLSEIVDYIVFRLKNPIAAENLVEQSKRQSMSDCQTQKPLISIRVKKSASIHTIAYRSKALPFSTL